jgi:hypothetical protein
MSLLNLATGDYPVSFQHVRDANPNVTFPAVPTDADLLPFGYANVRPTARPSTDPRTQRVEGPSAEPDGAGSYRELWTWREATPAEIAEWDDLNPPEPEWLAFSGELGMMPQIVNLLRIVFQVNPAFFSQLTIGLSDAAKGDSRLFLGAWSQAIQNQLVNQELIDIVANLAIKYHLPTSFVDGLKNIS